MGDIQTVSPQNPWQGASKPSSTVPTVATSLPYTYVYLKLRWKLPQYFSQIFTRFLSYYDFM